MRKPLTVFVTLVCLPILLAGPIVIDGLSDQNSSFGPPRNALQADDLLQLSGTSFSRSEELPRVAVSRIPHMVFLIIFILLLLLFFDRPESSLKIATIGSSTSRRW